MEERSEIRPVDNGVLRVYDLPPDGYGEITMTAEVGTEFMLPYFEDEAREKATVEVEVRYATLGLDRDSLVYYLAEYADVEVTQEGLAYHVREDLSEVLGTNDVFVNVKREYPDQHVRIGSII